MLRLALLAVHARRDVGLGCACLPCHRRLQPHTIEAVSVLRQHRGFPDGTTPLLLDSGLEADAIDRLVTLSLARGIWRAFGPGERVFGDVAVGFDELDDLFAVTTLDVSGGNLRQPARRPALRARS
jgi:hypothetical protein